MRFLLPTLIAGLAFGLSTGTQDERTKPKVNPDPLTDKQIAVYRVVVQHYLGDSKDSLNLSISTEPIKASWVPFNGSCPNDSQEDAPQPVIHHFSQATIFDKRLVVVDPGEQQKKIDQGDPQILLKKAIDEGGVASEDELKKSVKRAVENGLFSLSEIVFDKKHQRALVAYSFVCGSLCGNGNTLILRLSDGKWRISKTCTVWMS
jgi:hypothetical protein